MIRKEVWELSAEDFFTHIITIICDYAKINGYEITDAVKTIGESLQKITEIATFDNWEINEEALGKDINVTSKWIPCSERLPTKYDNLLICQSDGYVNVGYYSLNGFKDMNSYPYKDVIAWQPLPEPYKEE